MNLSPTLVVCLTVFIAVGVPAAMYVMVRRGDIPGLIELTRRAALSARNPWQREDEQLQELSRLAADLRAAKEQEEEHPPPTSPPR